MHGPRSEHLDLVFPGANQSVDVVEVHILHLERIPDSRRTHTTPIICEYKFMSQLWYPAVLQAMNPRDLAQALGPRSSYVCPSGRTVQARVTLT